MDTVRVLIIEDQDREANDARREITDRFTSDSGLKAAVTIERDFDRGFEIVEAQNADVVVLDVRRDVSDTDSGDDLAGKYVYERIKRACFTPIVFWTAVPRAVDMYEMRPLVSVIAKDDTHLLPDAIHHAVTSDALTTIRNIEANAAEVLRRHMWDELAPNWNEYAQFDGANDVAQVLLSRLARIIDEQRDPVLLSRPSHRYVYPPVSDRHSPGDILRASDSTWWIILTPACDFEQNKVEFVLLAGASSLTENDKYIEWRRSLDNGSNGKNKWNNLKRAVLGASSGRYYYLPAFREIPDLVVDLDNLKTVSLPDLNDTDFTHVGSLVSPFTEALLAQHSHLRGRIGVPDLDFAALQQRLQGLDAQIP
ncbi:MAG: hypothetical protein E7Z94_09535 [Actinomyces ruminicola]|nr:hypothetical protein [Actinomyces ruminicola]